MKKHLLTIFALSAVTWACFALSVVVCRGEIAATIASARSIKAVRLQTLNSAIIGLPGDEQQSILRREGFSSFPQLQQQFGAARETLTAAIQDQAHTRLLTQRAFTALLLLSFLTTVAVCILALWRSLDGSLTKVKAA
jgi:hypothetical protein